MIPLLILHGALGDKTQMQPLAKRIRESGQDVYTMNFSGHGGEPFSKAGFGIEVFVNDVISFMNHHQLKQVDIFGYSMGGYVALLVATQYANHVRGVITLGTKFDWSPQSAEREVKKMNPEKIIEKVPAFARILEHRHTPNDWKELMSKTAMMMTSLGAKPLLNELNIKALKQRVIIALGDEDDMADRNYSEQMANGMGAQFILLPNTPHPIEKVDLSLLVNLNQGLSKV